jgi:hypothetical protein
MTSPTPQLGRRPGRVIGWTTTTTSSAPGALLDHVNGDVAVEWAGIAVVGVYSSPNSGLDAYGDFLHRVSNCMRRRCRSRQVPIRGDFNALSSQWGDIRINTRGRMLSDWAAGLGLLLTNRGSMSTCVACRGSTVVEVTWTTASLHRQIRNWRVAEEVETLSDHLYIMMELTSETASTEQDRSNTRGPSRSRPPPTPRWRLKERDRDQLQAPITVSAWS